MQFPTKKFEDVAKEMKAFGDYLMPYNFPKTTPADEECINFIKTREITVDGYSLVLYYSKADWNDYYLQILQITGRYVPFLPFSLICKIGKKFLGEQYISYVDFIKENQKVYVWTVTLDNNNNNPIISPFREDAENCNYEGFCYTCLNPAKVNFY